MTVPIVPDVALAGSTYGSGASMFDTEATTVTTASSATVLSPPGFYFVITGAQNSVQYSPDGGGTYRTLLPASSESMVWSDGITVQVTNTSTGGTSARYVRIRGSV